MKRYILTSSRKSDRFVTDNPSEITTKILFLQSEGVSLIDIRVTEVDTEKYPPTTVTAPEWITMTSPPPEEPRKAENRFNRALGKIEELWKKLGFL